VFKTLIDTQPFYYHGNVLQGALLTDPGRRARNKIILCPLIYMPTIAFHLHFFTSDLLDESGLRSVFYVGFSTEPYGLSWCPNFKNLQSITLFVGASSFIAPRYESATTADFSTYAVSVFYRTVYLTFCHADMNGTHGEFTNGDDVPTLGAPITALQSSKISDGLNQLRGVAMTTHTPGIRDGGVRGGRSNHGTPKGSEHRKHADTVSKSSAGSARSVQKIGPVKQSVAMPQVGAPATQQVTEQLKMEVFRALHTKLAVLDRLVAESVCADIALSATTNDATEHTKKMDGVRELLGNYRQELGERLLGAVAKECTQLLESIGETPPPEEEPPDIWALSQAVNYSVACMPEIYVSPQKRSFAHFVLFVIFSVILTFYSILHFGETMRTYVELMLVIGMVYLYMPRTCPAAAPLNLRVNSFIDVKAEATLLPIGTPYDGQLPGSDDIMVYCGYKTNYITYVSLHMLAHLKTVKSGSKLTEMNVQNMLAEICLKFPNKYEFTVYQETAIHAHQLFQAARARRHMTCTHDNHAPLRHDARAWNPS